MALQTDIQYVPFHYVDGSAARKLDRQSVRKTTAAAAPAPKRRRAKRKVIAVDPVAICGLLVVVVMLCAMIAGYAEYRNTVEKTRQLSERVSALQTENALLEQTYRDGYDLESIQQFAEVLGMVPAQDVQQVSIQVDIPQEETVELSFWESVTTFLAGLFA